MSQSESHIRFGIICDAHTLREWQVQCIRRALAIQGVELAVVMVESRQAEDANRGEKSNKAGTSAAWRWVQRRVEVSLPALQQTSLQDVVGDSPVIECKLSQPDGSSAIYSEADVEVIRAENLDFIIRFGAGRVEGEILGAARLGLWFFQMGDGTQLGQAVGFWEIFHGSLVSSCSLRQFGASIKEDRVLRLGRFRTIDASYSANLSQLLMQGSRWLVQVCQDIAMGDSASYLAAEGPPDSRAYSEPGNLDCLIFYFRLKRNKLRNFCSNLFVHRHWGLALSFAPIEDLWLRPATAPVTLLPLPTKATFHADPFGYRHQDGLAILHERWSNSEAQGTIACSFVNAESLDEMRQASSIEAGVVRSSVQTLPVDLKFPHHSSYPYIFQHGGQYYCIPETSEAGRVSLYRFEGSPEDWVHLTDIIADFAAVDSSVIHHEGKWWLFCTNLDDNPDSHLYIWQADELQGPWQQHLNNPVKMDICSARPAGTPFEFEGDLYRPAQDSSGNYGGSISIQKVTQLSLESFSEEYCGDLKRLADSMNVDGMHTLSRAGDCLILDYYKRAFLPTMLVFRMKRYLHSKRST